MLSIRNMTPNDVPVGMRLKTQAGWNQTEADWQRFLWLEPRGCFVAEWSGRPVGTTTTCTFAHVGWIAMVLVEEAYRHRGIATRLVQHALDYLAGQGVTSVRLDATPLGRPVYERLGFVARYDLVRFEGLASPSGSSEEVRSADAAHLPGIIVWDCQAVGVNRGRLLERLLFEQPERVGVLPADSSRAGYVMWRPGSGATQIGPAASLRPVDGEALLDWALRKCRGRPVFADIPVDNRAAVQWADSRGLTVQRHFTRMDRGPTVGDHPDRIWSSSGPEKG
jgi:GNAT superfamily N-acetyltransferase